MIEASIDAKALDQLAAKLERSPHILREAKRKAFEAAAPKLKSELDHEIGGSGKVRNWQAAYVGSKGGYAAVRPKAKTYAEDSKGRTTRYQVGAVTNAINSGHRFPTPSGKKRYRARIKIATQRVPGKHFYEAAQGNVPQIAQETAEQVAQTLIHHLEG